MRTCLQTESRVLWTQYKQNIFLVQEIERYAIGNDSREIKYAQKIEYIDLGGYGLLDSCLVNITNFQSHLQSLTWSSVFDKSLENESAVFVSLYLIRAHSSKILRTHAFTCIVLAGSTPLAASSNSESVSTVNLEDGRSFFFFPSPLRTRKVVASLIRGHHRS